MPNKPYLQISTNMYTNCYKSFQRTFVFICTHICNDSRLRQKHLYIFVIFLFLILGANFVYAADIPNPLGTGRTFDKIIITATEWAAAIAIPLTTLMILVAGFLYLTGGGNPEQIKKAHQALIWAVVGLIVVLFSGVTYALVKNILGT